MNVLHPGLKRRVEGVLVTLSGLGVAGLGVYQWGRSFEEQDALYAQGRTKPGEIVTHAQGGDSWHQYGLAADLVFKVEDKWSWDYNRLPYEVLGKCAMSLGLEWGGVWLGTKRDPPHVQLTGGLQLWEAKTLYKVGGLEVVWDAVDRKLAGI